MNWNTPKTTLCVQQSTVIFNHLTSLVEYRSLGLDKKISQMVTSRTRLPLKTIVECFIWLIKQSVKKH